MLELKKANVRAEKDKLKKKTSHPENTKLI